MDVTTNQDGKKVNDERGTLDSKKGGENKAYKDEGTHDGTPRFTATEMVNKTTATGGQKQEGTPHNVRKRKGIKEPVGERIREMTNEGRDGITPRERSINIHNAGSIGNEAEPRSKRSDG